MHLLTKSAPLLALFLALTQGAAQTKLPTDEPFATNLAVGPGTFFKALTGRIGDDQYLDAVAMLNDNALYLQDPVQHNVAVPLLGECIDAAVLRGANGATRDPVVVLDDQGLHVFACAVGEQDPTAGAIITQWAGAQCVWSGTNAAGQALALGIGAGGTSLLRWKWQAGTLVQAAAPLSVPTGITKVMTANYDGTGEVELVLQMGGLFYVLSWSGAILQALVLDSPVGNCVTVSRGNGTQAWQRDLVVVCGVYGGQRQLVGWNSSLIAPIISVNDLAVTDIAAANLDATGGLNLDEILLADGASVSRVHVIRRVDTLAMLQRNNEYFAGVTGSIRPAAKVDCVLGGDFDNDGDGDVLAFQSTSTRQVLQVLPGIVAPASRPILDVPRSSVAFDEQAGTLSMTLIANLPPLVPWRGDGSTTELECAFWFRPAFGTYQTTGFVRSMVLPTIVGLPQTMNVSFSGLTSLGPYWSVEMRGRLVAVKNGVRRPLVPWRGELGGTPGPTLSTGETHEALTGEPLAQGISGDGVTTGATGLPQTPPRR